MALVHPSNSLTELEGNVAPDLTALTARVTTVENDTKETTRTAVPFSASPYTVLSTDTYLEVDATNGAVVINLLAAASGRALRVVKVDASANSVTVTPNGAETVDGDATLVLPNRYSTAMFHPSTSKYIIEAD